VVRVTLVVDGGAMQDRRRSIAVRPGAVTHREERAGPGARGPAGNLVNPDPPAR
jgi:hypothetical protein